MLGIGYWGWCHQLHRGVVGVWAWLRGVWAHGSAPLRGMGAVGDWAGVLGGGWDCRWDCGLRRYFCFRGNPQRWHNAAFARRSVWIPAFAGMTVWGAIRTAIPAHVKNTRVSGVLVRVTGGCLGLRADCSGCRVVWLGLRAGWLGLRRVGWGLWAGWGDGRVGVLGGGWDCRWDCGLRRYFCFRGNPQRWHNAAFARRSVWIPAFAGMTVWGAIRTAIPAHVKNTRVSGVLVRVTGGCLGLRTDCSGCRVIWLGLRAAA